MGQLRYYTRDLAFYLLLVAMMGMPAVRAYSLDLELADNPTAYLVNKAKEKRILLIGTHHRNAYICLLYTSDAADDLLCVDLGGRRILKKKTNKH